MALPFPHLPHDQRARKAWMVRSKTAQPLLFEGLDRMMGFPSKRGPLVPFNPNSSPHLCTHVGYKYEDGRETPSCELVRTDIHTYLRDLEFHPIYEPEYHFTAFLEVR